MQHLIIFAHPNRTDSFNKAVLNAVVNASEQQQVSVEIRDLYALNFNPILSESELKNASQHTPADIVAEQQLIDQADFITIIYPLWWMGFPAILKGYFDRILSHGFAYKTENGKSVGLLHGKKMQQFITLGNSAEKYQCMGFDRSLKDCLVDGLFNFCGITDIEHRLLGDVHGVQDAERQAMLDQVFQQMQKRLAE